MRLPTPVQSASGAARFPGARARRLLLLLGAAVAVGCVAVSQRLLEQAGSAPAAEPEVNRQFVELRQGRVYRLGQAEPFTGWLVEQHENGSPKSRSRLRHGRLNGISEGWFPDGQLQVREHFVEGLSHGWRTKWHPNGQRLSEAQIRQGKIDGVFRRWHDHGVLAEEVSLRAGEPDGVSRSWHPSGSRKARVLMKDGAVVEQSSWPDGLTQTGGGKARVVD